MRKLIEKIYDLLTGRCIRRIQFEGAPANAIYLTFDDGPVPEGTNAVLDLLKRHETLATFFLIGEKALKEEALTKKIQNAGHAIGNHSIDHDTKKYFKGIKGINNWLYSSHQLFENVLHIKTIGFRSPLGFKTPPLNVVLKAMKWPLILWDVRFYDTNYGLTRTAVEKKLPTITPGSIILLHDTHSGEKKKEFLESLDYLISECKKRNLIFKPLEKELVEKSYVAKYGRLN